MHVSHDADRSDSKDLCSLGVVDLDLSLSPDALGLRAFDSTKPLTRMLSGSFPCELRLMLPDSKIATDGFYNVIVENLAASPTWRSRYIFPRDVTSLELGQLWRCPVEWCAVEWCAVVSDCLGHLQDKHGGSQYVALKNIAKFFPPWTVPRADGPSSGHRGHSCGCPTVS